jgi:glycosidase
MYPHDTEKLRLGRTIMQRKARDNARTPVQWDDSPHGGFTSANATPWMRVNDDYPTVNAATQLKPSKSPNELSVHAFWKRGMENRKKHKDAFVYGDFELLDESHSKIFAYVKSSDSERWVVALNFSAETVKWEGLGELKISKWVVGNYDESLLGGKATSGTVELKPWEGMLGLCE